MAWSNQVPPQIVTQPDGTTIFEGPITVDATDGTTAITLQQDGSINGKQGNFNDVIIQNPNGGSFDIAQVLANLPQGLIAAATLESAGPTQGSGNNRCLVMITSAFQKIAGRAYLYTASAGRVNLSGGAAGQIYIAQLVAYSTYPNSSNYASNYLTLDASLQVQQSENGGWIQFGSMMFSDQPITSATFYLGYMIYSLGTASFYLQGASLGGTDQGAVSIAAYDMGKVNVPGFGAIDPIPYSGGTPPPPPPQQYSKTYYSTWGQTYENTGEQFFYGDNGYLYQGSVDAAGGSGHNDPQHSFFNFDYNTIASDLNGASNISMTLFVYCAHAYNNSGMTANLQRHNTRTSSAPSNLSGIGSPMATGAILYPPNPGWVSLGINSATYSGFINGTLTGFGFFENSFDLAYYGYFTGPGHGPSPYLQVSYQK